MNELHDSTEAVCSGETLPTTSSSDLPDLTAFPAAKDAQATVSPLYSSLQYADVARIIAAQKEKAGKWFPHLGYIEKIPESTTKTMMKQPFLPACQNKLESLLPSRYKIRQQQATNYGFPFSIHDNRHTLENFGSGLDEGLGRKKLPQVQMYFEATNFNCPSNYVPTPSDGISTYQASYLDKPKADGPFFRRYPKHHSDRWQMYFM